MALIGVRAVLGVENVKGSPFNVQRSVHIPNLTHDEVVYFLIGISEKVSNRFNLKSSTVFGMNFKGNPG
jgi:hypothetical protein